MTMLALGKGTAVGNALIADTIAGTPDGRGGFVISSEQDRIFRVFGRTYASLAGDSTVLDSLMLVHQWLDPIEPALREPEVFHAILEGAERLRTIRRANKMGIDENPSVVVLVVCSPSEAFYWSANFDRTAQKYTRDIPRVDVAEGTGVVVWGGHIKPIASFDDGEPFKTLIDGIVAVDEEFREAKKSLGYEARPDARYSGVMTPRAKDSPVMRRRAFASVPEQMALLYGGDARSLTSDPRFTEFPLRK